MTSDTLLIPEITPEQGQRDIAVQNTASAIDQAVMGAEEIFRDLGRIETAAFYATISDSILAQTYQRVKKTKGYKNIPYIDANGKTRHFAGLEEFCTVKLGKSARRLQELSQNLHILGPNLYESAEKIGFRAKDYRALKALPAEDQEIVKQALASDSKDEVLSILEDMAARNQAEREAAKKEKAGLEADLKAREQLLNNRSKRLEQAEEELSKLKSLPPDERVVLELAREENAVRQIDAAHIHLLAETNQFYRAIAEVLGAEEISLHTKEYAVSVVRAACQQIAGFVAEHGIGVDFEDMVAPAWLSEAAEADLTNGNTEQA